MTFRDKLLAAASRNDSLLCVGLDPQLARMPVSDVGEFCRAIIEATQDLVCVYKPQIAFFEALGVDGWRVLKATIDAVPDDIPVLLDAKRGDVASTAEAYATACFDVLGADAVTVNAYLGSDAVEPFPGSGWSTSSTDLTTRLCTSTCSELRIRRSRSFVTPACAA